MQRFSNKVALVTGAGSGIGKASALRIAAESGSVFCVDLDQPAVDATVQEIIKAGGTAMGHICDVSREQDVIDCVKACVSHFGSLYALINMAGILRFDDYRELQLAQWQRVLDVNLTGTMLMCREALPSLIKSGGSIVNAASTSALSGLPCAAAYSASKGAVLAMTRTIAVDFAKLGVRANCVCPGEINSGMTVDIEWPDSMDFDLLPRVLSLTGPKDPEAVSGVIAMLASEDGIHITGEDIRVDGGMLS